MQHHKLSLLVDGIFGLFLKSEKVITLLSESIDTLMRQSDNLLKYKGFNFLVQSHGSTLGTVRILLLDTVCIPAFLSYVYN